ncbi:cytochrome c-552 [Acrasis kona]|uniref:Cytochrome c-552 n=1 Tax=Acrasis kona TaxID=1008807 RepID=A0AAW2ZG09_9EUKA
MVRREGVSMGVRTNSTVRYLQHQVEGQKSTLIVPAHSNPNRMYARSSTITISLDKDNRWEFLQDVNQEISGTAAKQRKCGRVQKNKDIKKLEFKTHLVEQKSKQRRPIREKSKNEDTKPEQEEHFLTWKKTKEGCRSARRSRELIQKDSDDFGRMTIVKPLSAKHLATRNMYHTKYVDPILVRKKIRAKRDTKNEALSIMNHVY